MKRIIAIATVLMMILVMSGCGRSPFSFSPSNIDQSDVYSSDYDYSYESDDEEDYDSDYEYDDSETETDVETEEPDLADYTWFEGNWYHGSNVYVRFSNMTEDTITIEAIHVDNSALGKYHYHTETGPIEFSADTLIPQTEGGYIWNIEGCYTLDYYGDWQFYSGERRSTTQENTIRYRVDMYHDYQYLYPMDESELEAAFECIKAEEGIDLTY